MIRRLLFASLAAVPSAASAAPLSIQQGSPRNIVRIIQQRSAIVSIDRSVTASNGRRTITEIVRIGPDPDPVRIQQSGISNYSAVFQQGRDPKLELNQQGEVNRERTLQYAIP